MPYKELSDLPDSVQHVLPKHAQEIYLAVFNNAWEEYKNPEDRYDGDSREVVAHKVAWAAVKHSYEKVDEKWKKKKAAS